jgi:hypothetical protein
MLSADSVFSKLQATVQAAANGSGNFSNINSMILKPKINASYSLRLLWLQPYGTCTREYPMINQYIHHYWDDTATSGKDKVVYCPTSQYIKGETKAGFESCPICTECSKLYKASQEGSTSAGKLYKTFRRTFRGYVPVYVVNGPDDVVGQVKILQYSKMFKDFFDRKIFGVAARPSGNEEVQPIDPDEVIGIDAFMYVDKSGNVVTDGYNLNIQVTSKKMVIEGRSVDMPQYTLDFSRKNTSILNFGDDAITTELFNGLNEQISFDSNFYNESSVAELNTFKLKYVTAEETVEETTDEDVDSTINNLSANMNPYATKTPAASVAPAVATPPPVKTAPVVEKVTQTSDNGDDDIDVDALINDL